MTNQRITLVENLALCIYFVRMGDSKKLLEEKLREAACFSDLFLLQNLLNKGVDVNSKNEVNGWTALHWAAHRNNFEAVSLLIKYGAEKNCLNAKGESPKTLSTDIQIQKLLGGAIEIKEQPQLPITPNYIKNPPLFIVDENKFTNNKIQDSKCDPDEDLVLKIRLAESKDSDFIEIELSRSELTISKLKEVCADELNINPNDVESIRKLPNTRLRKDKDIQRLKDYQELEVIVFPRSIDR